MFPPLDPAIWFKYFPSQAIMLINTTEKWGAEVCPNSPFRPSSVDIPQVVYGDTDSVFVYVFPWLQSSWQTYTLLRHLPGKTKDQAFRIGYDISETITSRSVHHCCSTFFIGLVCTETLTRLNSNSRRLVRICGLLWRATHSTAGVSSLRSPRQSLCHKLVLDLC